MERVKTWRVVPTADGVVLSLNGTSYQLGGSTDAIRFDLQQAQPKAHELAVAAAHERRVATWRATIAATNERKAK